ncbi:TonB-dependent siderophore receptor [Hyphomicrobium sp. LHD-15]|uniref:TonB-dependent receptor n=1 Tax=Hyphomicrobium sp. LHD-15 TaxID=3072142 RepID=UPI0028107458|nr:TonB-dependent siderophore receptor [Hyphomicrobium sp. LHD-15]MDQ8699161.1 TonB-dependent siderophore receptor [Hyphomicrobium sp. LHD-15]
MSVQKRRSPVKTSRSSLLALAAAASAFAGEASAQTTSAAPASEPTALPPLEVTTANKQKKKAKASAKKVTAGATQSAAADASAGGGASAQGETKPGLNLDAPAGTGSRLGLSPLETPASVEVIPGDTVRDRGQTSVNQAVTQNAAGFTSTAAPGNGGSGLAARGFAGHGSVMQLYDGTRLYVGSGTVTFPFDTWSAERIEVLRGPASVLYGEGAVGGVINVVPKKPTDYFTHEAEVAVGTDATRRFGVGSGGPINDKLFYRFDASGIQSDGWLERESDFSSLALSGALTYRPTSDLNFTISHDHGDQSPLRYWGTPLINGTIPERLRDKNFNVRDSDVSYVDNWTQFKTEWSPTDWLEMRNVAYRLTSNRHWRNVESYAYQTSGPFAGRVLRSDYIEIFHDQEQIGNRFDATVRTPIGGGVKNELVVGFDVNSIDFLNRSNSPFAGTSSVDPFNPDPGWFGDKNNVPAVARVDSETFQHAFFAEDRLTLSKELTVVAGIRLDKVSLERADPNATPAPTYFEKDFSETSWRVGAVYTPVPGLAFYGQYATAVDPIGGALLSLSLTNSQYQLATSRQYEVGVKQSFWGGRGEWTLAAYDIEKNNILSRDPDNPTLTRQIGQQSSRGVEASLGLQLTDTLRYDGNVAVLEARFDEMIAAGGVDYTGNRPPNVPEQVVNSWLTWAFLPKWEAYAGVQWIGSVYNNDANTLKRPASTVVNMGLSYDVTDKSEIALRVFNVFDEKYATGGSSTEWQLAPPRSAELSYRIKY